MTLQVAVLEVHARAAARLWREADFDLARLREIRLELPLAADLPGPHEAMRRLPHQHRSPLAIAAVLLLRVEASADTSLDDGARHRRLADVMRSRPPEIEFGCEHVERPLLIRLHCDRLAHCGAGRLRRFHVIASVGMVAAVRPCA